MIKVKRYDYPSRTMKRTGKVIPAHYYCEYFYGGKEIANYDSLNDLFALRTDLIGMNFKKTPYERALECKINEAYRYLFDMLGVDKTSNITEYTKL